MLLLNLYSSLYVILGYNVSSTCQYHNFMLYSIKSLKIKKTVPFHIYAIFNEKDPKMAFFVVIMTSYIRMTSFSYFEKAFMVFQTIFPGLEYKISIKVHIDSPYDVIYQDTVIFMFRKCLHFVSNNFSPEVKYEISIKVHIDSLKNLK